MKVNNFANKIPDTTTSIHINEYNTDKQKIKKKIPDTNGLVDASILDTKTGEVNNKIPDHAKINSNKFNLQ